MKYLVTLVLSVAMLCGCAALKGTTTHKVTVTQHSLLSLVQAFQSAEEAEYAKGFVPVDVHVKIEQGEQKTALAFKDLDDAMASGIAGPDLQSKVDAIYQFLDSVESDGLTAIKNPTTRQTLETALDSVKALVDTILIQLKSAPTTVVPVAGK